MTSAATRAPPIGAVGGVGGPDDGPVAAGRLRQLVRPGGSCPSRRRRTAATTCAWRSRPHPPPLRLEEGQLVVAPDEGRSAAGWVGVERSQGDGLPHLDGLLLALEEDRLAGAERDSAPRQLGRQAAAEHLSGPGRLLEAGGHVDGVADDGACPRPPPTAVAITSPELMPIEKTRSPAEVPHGQAGGDRSLGVVVMGDRDAEHRHHASRPCTCRRCRRGRRRPRPARRKAASTIRATTSGSVRSANDVKPTTSANRTVASLRSSTGSASSARGGARPARPRTARRSAGPSAMAAPHDGHADDRQRRPALPAEPVPLGVGLVARQAQDHDITVPCPAQLEAGSPGSGGQWV